MTEIFLRSSQERMEALKVGPYRRASRGDIDGICEVLAHFMVGADGRYMPADEANAALDDMSFGEMAAAFENLQTTLVDSAAPKATETPSSETPA